MEKEENLSKEIEWIVRDKYGGNRPADISRDIERLKAGEPVDYIIGWKEFLGSRIGLYHRPPIPRPETEHWVELAIKEIKRRERIVMVADIFSGSGCIGIAVLSNTSNARVHFGEVNPDYIRQIKLNLEVYKNISDRYKVVQSYLFADLPFEYDFILANPPYIPESRKGELSKSVVDYEDLKALFAGNDGLSYIEEFLKSAPDHLKVGGEIWMEFDETQKEAVEEIIKREGKLVGNFFKDQFSKWRYLRATQ